MIQSLLRSIRRLARGVAHPDTAGFPETSAGSSGHPEASPLTGIRRRVQDAQALVEHQFDSARLMDRGLGEIEQCLLEAWRERQGLVGDYHDLLRGVFTAIDAGRVLAAQQPEIAGMLAVLEKLIHAQGVEPIDVAVGDRFQPETQCCEEAEPSFEAPPGTVLQVLETGYQRRLPGGAIVVVRPARVVVSKAAEKPKEQKPDDDQQVAPDRH